MTNRDRSPLLNQIVRDASEEHGLETFLQFWRLYEKIAPVSCAQAFYVREGANQWIYSRVNYFNVAIIGDGLVVDIEGDDGTRKGGLSIQSLRSVTRVTVHPGSLPGLRNSQNAKLVVITSNAGESEVGLHWVATTDEQEAHLLRFAGALTNAMSENQQR